MLINVESQFEIVNGLYYTGFVNPCNTRTVPQSPYEILRGFEWRLRVRIPPLRCGIFWHLSHMEVAVREPWLFTFT